MIEDQIIRFMRLPAGRANAAVKLNKGLSPLFRDADAGLADFPRFQHSWQPPDQHKLSSSPRYYEPESVKNCKSTRKKLQRHSAGGN